MFITYRKSHTGLRLILTSVTLNDLELIHGDRDLINSPYFSLFHRIRYIALQADYVTVVERAEYIHIMSVKSSPSYIWPKLTHTAVARSLCDS